VDLSPGDWVEIGMAKIRMSPVEARDGRDEVVQGLHSDKRDIRF
jgi:hypothetical protein